MKRIIILFVFIIALTGCKNREEHEKNSYLKFKSNLLEAKEYTSSDNLPCEIIIDVNRVNKEKISYVLSLFNPKENMNNIKAIVVHNYYTEDVFPSIGLFDKKRDLKINSDDKNVLKLRGEIESTEDIDDLNLELKVLIEYKTDNNKVKDIYYKST